MSMNNKKGFTLIELLVVISIISLLASIIFYSTSEAKLRGEDSKKIAQVVEAKNAIEIYRSNNNNQYPQSISATTKGLYREGSTEYNEAMGELVTNNALSAIPSSGNGSDYYYEERDDGTGQFIAVLNSSKFQDEENGCVTSLLDGECSYDLENITVEICNKSNECNGYDLSSGDTVMVPGTSGGGSQTASLCGASNNSPHDDYSYSTSCAEGASYASGSLLKKYNGTQQWAEWICRDDSDSSNIENCGTSPESTTPPACGPAEENGHASTVHQWNSANSFNPGIENEYCSTGVHYRPFPYISGIYSNGSMTNIYLWQCYTGASPDIPNGGSYVDCQYIDD